MENHKNVLFAKLSKCVSRRRGRLHQIILSNLAKGFSCLEIVWVLHKSSFWLNCSSKILVGGYLRQEGRRGIDNSDYAPLFQGYVRDNLLCIKRSKQKSSRLGKKVGMKKTRFIVLSSESRNDGELSGAAGLQEEVNRSDVENET